MNTDEKALIQKLNQGDQMAFELLFYRYRGKVYNFLKNSLPRQADAEGVLHEIFLRIWIARERIDPEQSFSSYIFRIARNLVIDHLRSHVNRMTPIKEEALFTVDSTTDASRIAEEGQLDEWLNENLKKLPEQRRRVFIMSRMEGLSYKQIAEKLDITENTVDTQIRRALVFLREEIKKLRLFLLF